VCVDVPLPHLDRPFDYLVPAEQDQAAQPGVRVRVKFSRQLVDGYLLARTDATDHDGKLLFLDRVVSPEVVLTPEVAALARDVALRYAGSLSDVLRLAVPPRHAKVEAEAVQPPPQLAVQPPDPAGWANYETGPGFLTALGQGRSPRAVWGALPGEDWPARIAEAVAATVCGGRGALVLVADARDLARLHVALGDIPHATLAAALGPAPRYRAFLAALRRQVPVVIGNRAAAFAPVADLGLVVMWDDGDDVYAEPRAPYPHAREVLLTRAQSRDAAVLLGGWTRTAEAQQLVATGWARELLAPRDVIRSRSPMVLPAGDEDQLERDPGAAAARLPSLAWSAAREALAAGAPVLVQVPRRGYLPSIACASCHTPARCPHCQGPLALPSAPAAPACRWCGRVAAAYACPACGGRRLRASVVGARRTAEELGRAFAGVAVRTSGRDEVLTSVPDKPAVVVCTPGAEPPVDGAGYGAVLLLDSWALLGRADLRAAEETLRRWLAAAALARPARAGGKVVVMADGGLLPVQALIRWDPAALAVRELDERRELGFPPAARMASLTGAPAAVTELVAAATLPARAELLGPVPAGPDTERLLIRVPRGDARALAAALHEASAVRSARKAPDPVRVQLDPLELI
jgi:primosomal protein N' (replication factor Y)